MMSMTLATTAALSAPLVLWLAGSIPSRTADRLGPRMARLTNAAAWLAFAAASVALLGHGFGPAEELTLASVALPFGIGDFSIGVYVDAVTVIMLMLVSLIGALVSTYARNYVAGEAQEGHFHKWLLLTLASILTLLVASNLLLFTLAWMTTSLCLHRLLTFYPNRPAAMLAAHKKFVFSRIGEASLFIASLLIGATLHTMDFAGVYGAMAEMTGPLPTSLQAAAWLIVLAAVLKCAQFPFHGWLM
jgi:NAD(P)H-quinone oxidoreductase subunit 5